MHAKRASCPSTVPLEVRMLDAVAEVEHEPNGEPYAESRPVRPSEAEDHRPAHHDSEGRGHWNERRLELPLRIRLFDAHDPDADRHQHEGEQRPDTCHVADHVLRYECREESHETEEE